MGCNNTADVFQQYATKITPVKLGEGSLSKDSIQWNNVFVSKINELYYTKNIKTGAVIKKFDFIDGELTIKKLTSLRILHIQIYS